MPSQSTSPSIRPFPFLNETKTIPNSPKKEASQKQQIRNLFPAYNKKGDTT